MWPVKSDCQVSYFYELILLVIWKQVWLVKFHLEQFFNKAGQHTELQLNNCVQLMNQELILYYINIYIEFVNGIYKNVEMNKIAC